MNKTTGFTLVELMVTLSVLAILIAIGVPGFNQFIQGQRTTTEVNNLIGAVTLGRSEALSRGWPVSLRSMDGDFNTGSELWLDGNGDGDFADPEDELVRAYDPAVLVSYTFSNDPLQFDASGWLAANYTINVLADSCKQENNRTINISRTGGINVVRNACP